MNKLSAYFQEYYNELVYKVTWPTLEELQSSTVLVLVASLILAIVIALLDFGFSNLMTLLYGLFN